MKNLNYLVIATAFLLISFSGISTANAQNPVSVSPTESKEERETVEKIVRAYLLEHPEVIREAIQALQVKEENQKRQATADNMKKFSSAIYLDADAPVLGNAKGDVTVVVFYDYFCGYCRKTIPGLQELIAKDPSLRIIYKEFPILGPDSLVAARASLAAERQGKFAAFHQAMLASDSANDRVIKSIADRVGLDYAQLQKDMADPKIADALARTRALAGSLNVAGTPAYLIGDQLIPGAITSESLANIIAAKRVKKEASTAPKAGDVLK